MESQFTTIKRRIAKKIASEQHLGAGTPGNKKVGLFLKAKVEGTLGERKPGTWGPSPP